MDKRELIAAVSSETEFSKINVAKVLDAVLATIETALKQKMEVRLTGFGTFAVVDREAQKSSDPRTGDEIDIPAHTVVRFKVGRDLREAMGGGAPRPASLRPKR